MRTEGGSNFNLLLVAIVLFSAFQGPALAIRMARRSPCYAKDVMESHLCLRDMPAAGRLDCYTTFYCKHNVELTCYCEALGLFANKAGRCVPLDEAEGCSDFTCEKEGVFPSPEECALYYNCNGSKGYLVPELKRCGNNMIFNVDEMKCDDPSNVPECVQVSCQQPGKLYPVQGSNCALFFGCDVERGTQAVYNCSAAGLSLGNSTCEEVSDVNVDMCSQVVEDYLLFPIHASRERYTVPGIASTDPARISMYITLGISLCIFLLSLVYVLIWRRLRPLIRRILVSNICCSLAVIKICFWVATRTYWSEGIYENLGPAIHYFYLNILCLYNAALCTCLFGKFDWLASGVALMFSWVVPGIEIGVNLYIHQDAKSYTRAILLLNQSWQEDDCILFAIIISTVIPVALLMLQLVIFAVLAYYKGRSTAELQKKGSLWLIIFLVCFCLPLSLISWVLASFFFSIKEQAYAVILIIVILLEALAMLLPLNFCIRSDELQQSLMGLIRGTSMSSLDRTSIISDSNFGSLTFIQPAVQQQPEVNI